MTVMKTENHDMEQQLVNYICSIQFNKLPVEVVNYCKLLIMDSIGVTFPGFHAPGCDAVTALAKAWGEKGTGSRILIHGYKVPPPLAALANSTMMHALDFDDTLDISALHTFVSILPSALASAEDMKNISGKQFITALVAGVDVICRLSLAIQRPLSWIRTATCGVFGAAAAVSKILNLDKNQTINALGIAYSQSSGNAQGLMEGCLVKRMQPGFAASAGVTSAYLARAGITGSYEFLHGKYGFYNLYENGKYDAVPVTKELGKHFSIMDLSIKPYPSCRMTHSAIDAALALLSQLNTSVNNIDIIKIYVSKMVSEMVGKPFVIGNNPQVDAQFSIPYTVSAALCRGDVCLSDFDNCAIFEDRIQKLAKKVKIIQNYDLSDKNILELRMNIHTKDGKVYNKNIKAPLGNPLNPMGIDQCRKKFHKCILASKVKFSENKVQRILNFIENIETAADVSELSALTCNETNLNLSQLASQ